MWYNEDIKGAITMTEDRDKSRRFVTTERRNKMLSYCRETALQDAL